MEPNEFERRIVQLEMGKFAMEKELSNLKSRLVSRELQWVEYKSFKTQLLSNQSEKEYFRTVNQEVQKLRQESGNQRNPISKHHRQQVFFAGMVFFFVVALVILWGSGFGGISGFAVKEHEPNLFLDKQVYKVGEPVYIHTVPNDAPYMIHVLTGEEEYTPAAQVFIPEHAGSYQVVAMIEWNGELKKFQADFKVE